MMIKLYQKQECRRYLKFPQVHATGSLQCLMCTLTITNFSPHGSRYRDHSTDNSQRATKGLSCSWLRLITCAPIVSVQWSAQAAISRQLRTERSNVTFFSRVKRQMSPPISCLCWTLGNKYTLRGQMCPFFPGWWDKYTTYFFSVLNTECVYYSQSFLWQ